MTTQEVLQQCTVEGNIVKLPAQQLDRKLYQDVAKALQLIGGKWTGGKTQGFVFVLDPTDLLAQIAGGETRNLKKEFQFFATPDDLADDLVFEAEIKPFHKILEPSAGQGSIIKAINRVYPIKVDCYELMNTNVLVLNQKKVFDKELNFNLIGPDFLLDKPEPVYDRIIMNPPFQKNQDIEHIRLAYDWLKPGGQLVAISSTHWNESANKKETQFREFLGAVGAYVRKIDAGKFKESGTMITTCMIIIKKSI